MDFYIIQPVRGNQCYEGTSYFRVQCSRIRSKSNTSVLDSNKIQNATFITHTVPAVRQVVLKQDCLQNEKHSIF